MSIPKEPRQLMINLMYLVLTALLALNVSAEVMNAFFSIDKGIEDSNGIVSTANGKVIESMEATVEEKTQYKPLVEQANKAKALSEDFNKYIDGLRGTLIDQAGGLFTAETTNDPTKIGRPVKFKDKEIPTRLFVDGNDGSVGEKMDPQGPVLRAKINETRDALVGLVDEVSRMEIEGTQIKPEEVAALKAKLSLSIDESQAEAAGKSWEDYTFGHMPVAAVYPILRKLQGDATNSAATIVNFLSSKIGATVIEFDEFEPVASAEKGYVIKGEKYSAEVFLSAFSSQAAEGISMTVNGSRLPIKEGKGTYTTTASKMGENSYNVTINVKNPFTGKVESYKKTFKYEVGERSVAVSADKMNVFYIGVDNPISVSAAGVNSNDLRVSVSGGSGKLKKTGSNSWNVTVGKPGDCKVNVTAGPLNDSKTFRVKRIPDPVARLGNKEDGGLGNGEFKAQQGLIAWLDNFDFDAKCRIQGFTVVRVPKREDPIESLNQGAKYNAKSKRIVNAAKPGDTYYYRDVKARCPGDSAGRKINSLVFNIK